eukprot:g5283.t1
MLSSARVAALALGLAAAAVPGCRAFFLGALSTAPATTATGTAQQCYSSMATTPHNSRSSSSWVRSRAQILSRSSGAAALLPLRMMSGDDEAAGPAAAGPAPEPDTKSPSELMDAAAEADFVARASAAPAMGPAMGPAKQPEEDKRKEREAFELSKPKENKWASGAFKRGVALQAVVLTFVIFLQLKPEEVGQLAICAPFSKATGCVGFWEWVQIVFLNAPIPPM